MSVLWFLVSLFCLMAFSSFLSCFQYFVEDCCFLFLSKLGSFPHFIQVLSSEGIFGPAKISHCRLGCWKWWMSDVRCLLEWLHAVFDPPWPCLLLLKLRAHCAPLFHYALKSHFWKMDAICIPLEYKVNLQATTYCGFLTRGSEPSYKRAFN